VLPLEKKDGRLKVLVHDPMDLELMDTLRFRMNVRRSTRPGQPKKIKQFIDTLLSETAGVDRRHGPPVEIDTAGE
jgi:hypothetical protein